LGATTERRGSGAIAASVRAHPLLVALVTLVTLLAGLALSAAREPTYESSAQVLLTPLPVDGRVLPRLPLLRESSDRTRIAQTASSLLESPDAAASAARKLGRGWTAERVDASITIEPRGESDVLSVTATANDPALAARLANEYARAALGARKAALRRTVASLIRTTQNDLRGTDPSSPVALDLAERLSDLRAIRTAGDPTLSLSRRADPPTSAIGTPGWLIGVLSLVAGLAVGIGSALIIDMVRPARVADAQAAVAATGLPVLARVPALGLLERLRPSSSGVGFRPAAAAALRMLLLQLESQPEARRRVLLAGVSAGEGATTSVAELGLTLARAGHDVLLLDADTREPTLAARLGARQPAPLSTSAVAEDDVVAVPNAPRLKLRAIGPQGPMGIPDDVAARLPGWLAAARAEFDYVLVDAPPLAESPDAFQLAGAVDAVVLVVRPGRTRLIDLEAGLGMLERTGGRPQGLLIVGGRAPAAPSDTSPVRASDGAASGANLGQTVEA